MSGSHACCEGENGRDFQGHTVPGCYSARSVLLFGRDALRFQYPRTSLVIGQVNAGVEYQEVEI